MHTYEQNALGENHGIYTALFDNLRDSGVSDLTNQYVTAQKLDARFAFENNKKELQNKDKQINQLQDKLDALKKIFNQFIISITSLSAWDIFFRGKHKDLISDFNSRIWITTKDNEVEDMDQPAILGDEGKK